MHRILIFSAAVLFSGIVYAGTTPGTKKSRIRVVLIDASTQEQINAIQTFLDNNPGIDIVNASISSSSGKALVFYR